MTNSLLGQLNARDRIRACYRMEEEFWYGIWKMLRMEDLKNGMENRLPY